MDHYEHIWVAERTKSVELYFATKSPTQRQFQPKYPGKKISHCHSITRLVEKFRNTGSVVQNNTVHCGPKPEVLLIHMATQMEVTNAAAEEKAVQKLWVIPNTVAYHLSKLVLLGLVGLRLRLKNLLFVGKQFQITVIWCTALMEIPTCCDSRLVDLWGNCLTGR